jgi:hypothetical protein
MGVGGQRHAPAALPPGGPVWTGAENLAPTGIRSPDRPSHSKSLYRLSYFGSLCFFYLAGNRTRGARVKGENTNNYTTDH